MYIDAGISSDFLAGGWVVGVNTGICYDEVETCNT